jgi:hypothetical protein
METSFSFNKYFLILVPYYVKLFIFNKLILRAEIEPVILVRGI